MVDLFGVRVCENGDPKDCELTPTAAKWMEVKNERMAGGHCMGFSVIAENWTFMTSRRFGARTPPVKVFTVTGDGNKVTSSGQKLLPDND